MRTIHLDPNTAMHTKVTLDDGNTFSFRPLKFENLRGYAPIIIRHENTGQTFDSYGFLEVKGHTFVSKWKDRFFSYDDTYINSREFVIDID